MAIAYLVGARRTVGAAWWFVVGLLRSAVIASRPALIVVLDSGTFAVGEAVFGFSSSGGAERVEFGGELGLGFDETAAVVAHGLVASVRVLGGDGDD